MKLIFLLCSFGYQEMAVGWQIFQLNCPRTKIVVEVKLRYHAIYLLIMLKVWSFEFEKRKYLNTS